MFRYLIAVVAVAALIVPAAQADRYSRAHSSPPQENAVSEWSLISQNAISAPVPPSTALRPPASSEVLHGLVHAAIYDAVVSVEGEYESLAVSVRAPRRTSVDAAVAAAARGVLVARVPTQAAGVEAAYAAALLEIPDGERKTNGIRVGRAIAGAYVSLRSDDRFDNPPPWVQPTTGPGIFEPIPPGSTPVDTRLANIRPLTFDGPARFRPSAPYSLASAAYAADFNEVKALGRATGGSRTVPRTETARFWTDHPMIQYNRVLRALALAKRLDIVETARMMAMVHVSAADAQAGCWWAKYHFNFWRPQHAIQRADTDGNAATTADPLWTHLVNGNHPEYPSGHQCITSGETYALEAYFGTDRIPLDDRRGEAREGDGAVRHAQVLRRRRRLTLHNTAARLTSRAAVRFARCKGFASRRVRRDRFTSGTRSAR